jgi:hypothetical protein
VLFLAVQLTEPYFYTNPIPTILALRKSKRHCAEDATVIDDEKRDAMPTQELEGSLSS